MYGNSPRYFRQQLIQEISANTTTAHPNYKSFFTGKTLLHKRSKLILYFILFISLQLQATGFGQITINRKNAPLGSVLEDVSKQGGYNFFYNEKMLENTKPVTINVNNADIKEVLEICFRDQPITYAINGKTIRLASRTSASISDATPQAQPPIDVTGRVVNEKGEGVVATVAVKGTDNAVSTDVNGYFLIKGVNENSILIITGVSIEAFEVKVGSRTNLETVTAVTKITSGEEVLINTGYQKLKPNEITGSVTHVNNELINRAVSPDILSRLRGVTAGVLITGGDESNSISNLRDNVIVRGYSTILSDKSPLIVVDDFPFDGDINSINPNDVNDITVLKDAAAASIWGTRAGNGVIIINTKTGKFNKAPKVSFNSNISISEKPDLFYSPTLGSSEFIDVETFLFNKDFYNSNITGNQKPALTPVVEILLQRKNGLISAADSAREIDKLRGIDVRNDLNSYYFKRPISQQYAVNLSGGSTNQKYFLSLGYDYDINSSSNYRRMSLNAINTYSLLKNKFEVTTGIWIVHSTVRRSEAPFAFTYPYGQLADDSGNPLPVAKRRQGYIDTAGGGRLLDWTYYPLKEQDYANDKTQQFNYRLNTSLRYKVIQGLDIEIKYQYGKQQSNRKELFNQLTYYTRDLINQFSSINYTTGTVTRPIPLGSILDQRDVVYSSHNLRGQINYNKSWKKDHTVNTIFGSEMSEGSTEGNSYRYYGYNEENGTSIPVDYVTRFPSFITGNTSSIDAGQGFTGLVNRTISIYTNMAYTFKGRYTLSLSGRRDGSNIFGTETNNKWKPLWSIGGSWNISDEYFYNPKLFSRLRLSVTYGYQGNVDNTTAALLTLQFLANLNRWRLPYARIFNHPNPDLRWEKIAQFNVGLDYVVKGDRISGRVEYYKKRGTDLLGYRTLPPSGGVVSTRANSANMEGDGIDFSVASLNTKGEINWGTVLNFSYARDRVTRYLLTPGQILQYISGSINPIVGRPITAMYSYRWAGLDPANGDPQGVYKGAISKNYIQLNGSTDLGDMIYHGPATPPFFGNMLNTVKWKSISLSFNISYKFGYYFRRPSINYTDLFGGGTGNIDYRLRWQKPGDENHTNVPSLIYPANSQRDQFYRYSEIHVLKGDHIRVQDIRFSYDLTKSQARKLPFQNAHIYLIVSNIGILWRANNKGIDPDFPPIESYTSGLPGKTIAAGFKIDF